MDRLRSKKADEETTTILQNHEENRRSTACSTIFRVETPSPEEIQTGLLELCRGDSDTRSMRVKRFWTYVKHKKNGKTGVSSLKQDRKLYSHPMDKEELLTKHFQSVFSSSEEVSRKEFSRNYKMSTVESQFPVLDNINITLNGITKLLKDLKPNKSPGPDNLGPRLLKELAEDIAPLLLMIFHKSLATGEVPDDWRTANVTAAFKKGQKYQAENYRPISLTNACCKIMEHVIASQIMNHGEMNNI